MSEPVRVLLVPADPDAGARVREGLTDTASVEVASVAGYEQRPPDTGEPTATDPGVDVDCVVGVPAGEPEAFAADLTAWADVPVVVYGSGGDESAVLAAGAEEVVRRDTDREVLAHRIRRVTDDERTVTADGGETTAAGRSSHVEDPLEQISDGFVTVDTDLEVTDANEAGREMLGVSGVVGDHVGEVFPDGTGLVERFEETLSTGEATTVEEYDAEQERWFEIRAYPVEEGLSVFLRDITERKRTQEELRASERSLHRLHEIASDPDSARSEKIERMLEVGRDRLGVELGFLTNIENDTQEIVAVVGDHPRLQAGTTAPLSEAYCRHTIGREEPLGVTDAREDGWEDDPAYERFGLACYLGATIAVHGEQYGTVCFAGTSPREREFTDSERTFVDLLTNWISYILEQRRYEDRIRANERRLETVTENVPVVVFAMDPEGIFTLARGRGLEQLGFESGEAVGESVFDLYGEYPDVLVHARRALNGEETHHTVELDDVTVEVWYQPVLEDGEVTQVVGVVRDITELSEHRERLSSLLDTTQSLMQARSREEVADLVANAAQDVFDFEITLVRLYDPDAGKLRPAARAETTAQPPIDDRPVYDVGEGMPGEVFATGESRVVDDIDALDVDTDTGRLKSAIYYPMGVHGTISVASTDRATFDETDEQVLGLLATAAAAACTRAKRERDVREAREHVETILERVNGLVEDTIEVLVGATTREELEGDVVTQLADADPHAFAWTGRPDVASETLSPTEWAGSGSVAVDGLSFDLDGTNPVATALRTETLQVVACDEDGAETLDCTPDPDHPEACVVIPLSYKDTTYGVIAVYADESGAFDEREQVVLSALGRAVANAINAVERGRILEADKVIELEFALDDPDLLFGRLSRGGDCTVEVADFDYRSDGLLRLYLTAEDADGDELADLARETDAVEEMNLIVDHEEECLLELAVEESLVERLSEYGAVVRSIVAENGTTRVTVELPYEAEARELFDLVEDDHPGTDLVGYHEHERPVGTRQEFRAALADRFTDRQETALRTAYFGGFFDWPRDIDGNDLADAMDVSRPTYHQHLRSAQRKVFDELFE